MGSSAIKPSKPTLILLHAGVCSASFFSSQVSKLIAELLGCRNADLSFPQLNDPRLNEGFNLVALESRFHGRSESEPRETFVAKVSRAAL